MAGGGWILRYALRGLAAGGGFGFLALVFSAYLDPAVYLPALSVLAMCR